MDLKKAFGDFLSKYIPLDGSKIRDYLPFVHVFGYEKQYGKVYPQDYARMVEAYKSWAYACAWKNATSVAKVDISLFKDNGRNAKTGKKDRTEIYQHPFLDLMRSVNPFTNRYELMTITQINMELTGNAYWWIPRNNLGIPYMIWQIPSHWMKVVPDADLFVSGYVLKVPYIGKFIPFDEDEIIHFKNPSPFDLYYGSGPTWGAQYGLDLNEQIKTWGINFFLNNAQPSGILTTESNLNPDQYQRLKDQWNAKYRGSKNAGKMAILENGLKYQQMGSTPDQARFPDVSKEIRDEIFACFGVPASKLGLSEGVNRANADTNDYTYQKETILPRLTLIQEKLNEKLIPIYDRQFTCEFENPVPQDDQFIIDERVKMIQCGFTTIDEERVKEGLKPFNLPETSKPLIPFNLMPAGSAQAQGNSYPGQDPNQGKDNKPGDAPAAGKAITKSKDHHWEIFVNTTAPQERLFAGVMKRYFESQHSEVMRTIHNLKAANGGHTKVAVSANIIFNTNEANNKLKNTSKASVREAYVAGLNMGMRSTNSTIDFSLFEPNIMRAVETRIGFFADKVNRTTVQMLKSTLDQAIQEGWTIDKVASEIDGIFNYSENFRSKRIAQTEIIGATNDGQVRAFDEAGIKQKEWLTARDEKVRDSHQIDGQVVDLTQSFKTNLGSHLLYPGDRSSGAPAEDVINCRCTVIPVI